MNSTENASKTIFWLFTVLVAAAGFASGPTKALAIPLYNVTDLGAVPGDASEAWGINSYGQVVGYTGTSASSYSAFLWTPTTPNGTSGTTTNLGTLPGYPNASIAWGINDSGQVVGQAANPTTSYSAFLWTPTTPNGTTGSMTNIGSLPGGNGDAGATAINNLGQIVGGSTTATQEQSFLWTPNTTNGTAGSMIDLGVPGGASPQDGRLINNSGRVGLTDASGNSYIWTPTGPNGTSGSMTNLGALPGGSGETGAFAMNNLGQVTGISGDDAFLWTPTTPNGTTGSMADLGFLPGDNYSYAYGMNDLGQIVGYSGMIASPSASNQQAVLWTSSTGFVNLNDYLTPVTSQEWNLLQATSINDAGQIIGRGYIDGVEHGYLLTPAPEPSTIALLGLGALVLAATVLRRRLRFSFPAFSIVLVTLFFSDTFGPGSAHGGLVANNPGTGATFNADGMEHLIPIVLTNTGGFGNPGYVTLGLAETLFSSYQYSLSPPAEGDMYNSFLSPIDGGLDTSGSGQIYPGDSTTIWFDFVSPVPAPGVPLGVAGITTYDFSLRYTPPPNYEEISPLSVSFSVAVSLVETPEPSSVLLLGLGTIGLAAMALRRRMQK